MLVKPSLFLEIVFRQHQIENKKPSQVKLLDIAGH